MNSSEAELREATAQEVRVGDEVLIIDLTDGRSLAVPLPRFPRLAHATLTERSNWRLIAGGKGIHRP